MYSLRYAFSRSGAVNVTAPCPSFPHLRTVGRDWIASGLISGWEVIHDATGRIVCRGGDEISSPPARGQGAGLPPDLPAVP